MKVFNKVLYIFLMVLGIVFIYQFSLYIDVKNRYLEFEELKNEYDMLKEEIVFYTDLKNTYEIVLKENNELDVDKDLLENKVNILNSEINDLKVKIDNLNKKINS